MIGVCVTGHNSYLVELVTVAPGTAAVTYEVAGGAIMRLLPAAPAQDEPFGSGHHAMLWTIGTFHREDDLQVSLSPTRLRGNCPSLAPLPMNLRRHRTCIFVRWESGSRRFLHRRCWLLSGSLVLGVRGRFLLIWCVLLLKFPEIEIIFVQLLSVLIRSKIRYYCIMLLILFNCLFQHYNTNLWKINNFPIVNEIGSITRYNIFLLSEKIQVAKYIITK